MSDKVVILNAHGTARPCTYRNCFEWVFNKDTHNVRCRRCDTRQVLAAEETLGVFPRPGREFTDRLNQLNRYSFWNVDNTVKRVTDTTGKWFEADEANALMDEAQSEINSLRARLERLKLQGISIDE